MSDSHQESSTESGNTTASHSIADTVLPKAIFNLPKTTTKQTIEIRTPLLRAIKLAAKLSGTALLLLALVSAVAAVPSLPDHGNHTVAGRTTTIITIPTPPPMNVSRADAVEAVDKDVERLGAGNHLAIPAPIKGVVWLLTTLVSCASSVTALPGQLAATTTTSSLLTTGPTPTPSPMKDSSAQAGEKIYVYLGGGSHLTVPRVFEAVSMLLTFLVSCITAVSALPMTLPATPTTSTLSASSTAMNGTDGITHNSTQNDVCCYTPDCVWGPICPSGAESRLGSALMSLPGMIALLGFLWLYGIPHAGARVAREAAIEQNGVRDAVASGHDAGHTAVDSVRGPRSHWKAT